MVNEINKTASAASVQRVTIDNLEAELFYTCPDIKSYEELEAYGNKVGVWALETAKINLPTLEPDDYDEDWGIGMEDVVDAGDLSSMEFTIKGRTFSAKDFFEAVCINLRVDNVDDITEEYMEGEVSTAVFYFVDEENPF